PRRVKISCGECFRRQHPQSHLVVAMKAKGKRMSRDSKFLSRVLRHEPELAGLKMELGERREGAALPIDDHSFGADRCRIAQITTLSPCGAQRRLVAPRGSLR